MSFDRHAREHLGSDIALAAVKFAAASIWGGDIVLGVLMRSVRRIDSAPLFSINCGNHSPN
jgi:hypothetical protein